MAIKGNDKGRGMANDGMPVKPPLSKGILSGREVKPPVVKPPALGKKK